METVTPRKDETVIGGAYLVDGAWKDANGKPLTRAEVLSYKEFVANRDAAAEATAEPLGDEFDDTLPDDDEELDGEEGQAAAASARKRRQAVAKAKAKERAKAKLKADETKTVKE